MSELPRHRGGTNPVPADLLDRMVRAVEKVRERLRRATAALNNAAIPYAVVGEQAVADWVARVDETAVRYSPAIDILLDRSDLGSAHRALAEAGFVLESVQDVPMFLDGEGSRSRDAIRIVFARQKVRQEDLCTAPGIDESEWRDAFRVLTLEPLIRMKLASFRRIDRVNIRDMIDVGLIDESWLSRLPTPLAQRLKDLLETPEG
jgi:hypothetical protein